MGLQQIMQSGLRRGCGLAAGLVAVTACAQQYPTRPIRFVVGFAAGGPTDVIARITAQDISAVLGQSIIVENRAGANAQIATELVAHATPDGHTLLFSSLSLLVNAILLEGRAKYDPFKDFAPISNAAVLPMVVVAGATGVSAKITTLKDLLALAKAKPGAVTYGAPGHGGSGHLAGALLENLSGTPDDDSAIPRQRAGADRCDRRPGDFHVLPHRRHRRACQRETPARAGCRHREAARRFPRHADHG